MINISSGNTHMIAVSDKNRLYIWGTIISPESDKDLLGLFSPSSKNKKKTVLQIQKKKNRNPKFTKLLSETKTNPKIEECIDGTLWLSFYCCFDPIWCSFYVG